MLSVAQKKTKKASTGRTLPLSNYHRLKPYLLAFPTTETEWAYRVAVLRQRCACAGGYERAGVVPGVEGVDVTIHERVLQW
jgi:hypothetical protein